MQPAVEGKHVCSVTSLVELQCGLDPVSKELIRVLAFKISMSEHLVISNENTIYTSFLERPLRGVRLVHSCVQTLAMLLCPEIFPHCLARQWHVLWAMEWAFSCLLG